MEGLHISGANKEALHLELNCFFRRVLLLLISGPPQLNLPKNLLGIWMDTNEVRYITKLATLLNCSCELVLWS